MVQFPRYRLTTPPGRDVERLTALRVTPFGHPRISGCLLLLVAYRSLPRPSSPSSSKASAVDPCPLAISPISPSLCPMPLEKDPVRSAAASEVRGRKPAHRCQRPVVTRRQRFAAQRRHRLSFSSRAASSPRWRGNDPDVAPFRIGLGRVGSGRIRPVESVPVEVWGLEPQTYGLQSHRSSHLSYTPADRHRRSTLWSAAWPRSTVPRARVVLLSRLKPERFCDNERDWGRAGPEAGDNRLLASTDQPRPVPTLNS